LAELKIALDDMRAQPTRMAGEGAGAHTTDARVRDVTVAMASLGPMMAELTFVANSQVGSMLLFCHVACRFY
jgi:hypothetical protein